MRALFKHRQKAEYIKDELPDRDATSAVTTTSMGSHNFLQDGLKKHDKVSVVAKATNKGTSKRDKRRALGLLDTGSGSISSSDKLPGAARSVLLHQSFDSSLHGPAQSSGAAAHMATDQGSHSAFAGSAAQARLLPDAASTKLTAAELTGNLKLRQERSNPFRKRQLAQQRSMVAHGLSSGRSSSTQQDALQPDTAPLTHGCSIDSASSTAFNGSSPRQHIRAESGMRPIDLVSSLDDSIAAALRAAEEAAAKAATLAPNGSGAEFAAVRSAGLATAPTAGLAAAPATAAAAVPAENTSASSAAATPRPRIPSPFASLQINTAATDAALEGVLDAFATLAAEQSAAAAVPATAAECDSAADCMQAATGLAVTNTASVPNSLPSNGTPDAFATLAMHGGHRRAISFWDRSSIACKPTRRPPPVPSPAAPLQHSASATAGDPAAPDALIRSQVSAPLPSQAAGASAAGGAVAVVRLGSHHQLFNDLDFIHHVPPPVAMAGQPMLRSASSSLQSGVHRAAQPPMEATLTDWVTFKEDIVSPRDATATAPSAVAAAAALAAPPAPAPETPLQWLQRAGPLRVCLHETVNATFNGDRCARYGVTGTVTLQATSAGAAPATVDSSREHAVMVDVQLQQTSNQQQSTESVAVATPPLLRLDATAADFATPQAPNRLQLDLSQLLQRSEAVRKLKPNVGSSERLDGLPLASYSLGAGVLRGPVLQLRVQYQRGRIGSGDTAPTRICVTCAAHAALRIPLQHVRVVLTGLPALLLLDDGVPAGNAVPRAAYVKQDNCFVWDVAALEPGAPQQLQLAVYELTRSSRQHRTTQRPADAGRAPPLVLQAAVSFCTFGATFSGLTITAQPACVTPAAASSGNSTRGAVCTDIQCGAGTYKADTLYLDL